MARRPGRPRQRVPARDRALWWATQVLAVAMTLPVLVALYLVGAAVEPLLPFVLLVGAGWLFLVWSPAGVFRQVLGSRSPGRERDGAVPGAFPGPRRVQVALHVVVLLSLLAPWTPHRWWGASSLSGGALVVGVLGMVVVTVLTRVAWRRLRDDVAEEVMLGRPFIGVPPEARGGAPD